MADAIDDSRGNFRRFHGLRNRYVTMPMKFNRLRFLLLITLLAIWVVPIRARTCHHLSASTCNPRATTLIPQRVQCPSSDSSTHSCGCHTHTACRCLCGFTSRLSGFVATAVGVIIPQLFEGVFNCNQVITDQVRLNPPSPPPWSGFHYRTN